MTAKNPSLPPFSGHSRNGGVHENEVSYPLWSKQSRKTNPIAVRSPIPKWSFYGTEELAEVIETKGRVPRPASLLPHFSCKLHPCLLLKQIIDQNNSQHFSCSNFLKSSTLILSLSGRILRKPLKWSSSSLHTKF